MKRMLLSTFVSTFFVLVSNGQIIETKKPGAEDHVFEKVPVEVSTNEKIWADHIKRKTTLPDSVLKNIPAGTYKIIIQFVVDKMGNIGQIKALNDPEYGLAHRAEDAVLSYKGEWKPAVQCGRNVKAYEKRTIVFIIP